MTTAALRLLTCDAQCSKTTQNPKGWFQVQALNDQVSYGEGWVRQWHFCCGEHLAWWVKFNENQW